MPKYTILHTIETGGPGGAETVFLHLASKIDTSRFRSLALLPDGWWLPRKLRQLGVPTYISGGRHWYDPRPVLSMARLIMREKVDLIHSHLVDQNFYSCLAGRLTGRKTIATYHGPVELTQSRGLKGQIKIRFVREAASAVVAVSDSLVGMLRERGFAGDKITRIYNGVSSRDFAAAKVGRLHRELGCDEGNPLVGMVANVSACKAYDCFIRAARKVADTCPQARFVSVGDIDPSLGQPLYSLVSQLGLQNRFYFLGFRDDVPDILRDLDIFVLSSVSEGLPLVVLEAMAAAKPIIATRCGGLQEVIEDGRTGFLVRPADPDALAERICDALSDPSRARSMGLSAQAEVKSRFTLEKMVHEYERLYARLLSLE